MEKQLVKVATLSSISLVALYSLYRFTKKQNKNKSLPPIAPGYVPIVGHFHHLLQDITAQELFEKWAFQTGPVYTCFFGSQTWIILNSYDAIKDLIVGRGSIYSSRKFPFTVNGECFQTGGATGFVDYGPELRRLRRIYHQVLSKTKIDDYQDILDRSRNTFLSYLYKASQSDLNITRKGISIEDYIIHYSMTSVLTIVFGNACLYEPGNPRLRKSFDITDNLTDGFSPADQMLEFFPYLKPLFPKRTKYLDLHDDFCGFYGNIIDTYIAKKEEDQEECILKNVLNEFQDSEREMMINFTGITVQAAADTVAITIEWLVAYLANHPKIQDKAYNEILNNVGLDRLPCPEDEIKLPYIQCVILEVNRVRPSTPLALPHSTNKDDVYNGWFIPKGTTVILNLYAAQHDPKRFPDPHKFIPERHLEYVNKRATGEYGNLATAPVDILPHLSFSTGRRTCSGVHLAERSLFLIASTLLACFKIERVSNELIDVNIPRDYHAGTWGPSHYEIKLTPRHDKIKDFIQ